ncbi:histidinol dehydrogenase [Floccifex sp.]|uniref:histidinol dehydrogenase n=1 Tax=Floccifex sp. TaxID=2815810 RepID=UPI003F09809D
MLQIIDKNNTKELTQYLNSRNQEISSDVLVATSKIIEDVRTNKDEACKRYTKQFDGIDIDSFKVSQEEIEKAILKCDPFFCESMNKAKENIIYFHQAQKQNSYLLQKEKGIYLGQRVLPLDSVGIYVPGGRAQYPSSVLMNALPAKVAGVERIVMVTPPSKDGSIHPNIAFAASIAGVTDIYKIGGAQAIAALAYGTETIPSVDKIVGPGNIFVAAAKKLVFGKVDIDMIAGPSEILVIADEKANPSYIAADLLSQAEHDPMASSILLTISSSVLEQVNEQLRIQSAVLPKKEIVEQSLKNYGKAILCDSIDECIKISNAIAPEHLELMIEEPMPYLGKVKNAGSVFMGYNTCESIGDYFGGTNHVLPTSGTARFSSALGVDSFIKKSSYLYYSQEAIQDYGKYIVAMAQEEQLQAHANAAKVRMKDEEN